MTFSHDDAGTPEDHWTHALAHHDLPALSLEGIRSLVVVAAHPDDETLGTGGLLREAAARGLRTTVVVATSGEASHPSSTSTTPAELAAVRRAETREAVALLSPGTRVLFAGLPDGDLTADTADLERMLVPLVDADTLVLAPWVHDGHPDHTAAGEVARAVGLRAGARVLEYPIWLWHWGGESDLPWAAARVIELDDEAVAAKRAAMARHVSQVAPIGDGPGDGVLLHPQFLAHFERAREVFVEPELDVTSGGGLDTGAAPGAGPATGLDTETDTDTGPDTDAARGTGDALDPARFDRMLEHDPDPWGVETRWYERRKRAVLLASLPDERVGSTLELGCSTGVLSRELALRSDRFLGLDVAARAVAQAADRNADLTHARFEVARLPGQWPGGQYDLVVLSEVAYYLPDDDRRRLIDLVLDALRPGGTVVVCHWVHPTDDAAVDGTTATAEYVDHQALDTLALHREEDFVLAVLARRPALSVARRTGVLG